MSNPALREEEQQELVAQLMAARRQVGIALKQSNESAEREARSRVEAAKIALGERGAVWWTDEGPDYNRHLVKNTPYAVWHAALLARESVRGEV